MTGEPGAVSQNICEEYGTLHYIIFIYAKISSNLAENTCASIKETSRQPIYRNSCSLHKKCKATWSLGCLVDFLSAVVNEVNKVLFHQPTLMHNFLYSLRICLLHYYPRHVSSINMPIFRRKNCIHTASGIFALCKRLHITLCNVQTFTESEDTRCCVKTIFPPEDGHVNARNMSRIIV